MSVVNLRSDTGLRAGAVSRNAGPPDAGGFGAAAGVDQGRSRPAGGNGTPASSWAGSLRHAANLAAIFLRSRV